MGNQLRPDRAECKECGAVLEYHKATPRINFCFHCGYVIAACDPMGDQPFELYGGEQVKNYLKRIDENLKKAKGFLESLRGELLGHEKEDDYWLGKNWFDRLKKLEKLG